MSFLRPPTGRCTTANRSLKPKDASFSRHGEHNQLGPPNATLPPSLSKRGHGRSSSCPWQHEDHPLPRQLLYDLRHRKKEKKWKKERRNGRPETKRKENNPRPVNFGVISSPSRHLARKRLNSILTATRLDFSPAAHGRSSLDTASCWRIGFSPFRRPHAGHAPPTVILYPSREPLMLRLVFAVVKFCQNALAKWSSALNYMYLALLSRCLLQLVAHAAESQSIICGHSRGAHNAPVAGDLGTGLMLNARYIFSAQTGSTCSNVTYPTSSPLGIVTKVR